MELRSLLGIHRRLLRLSIRGDVDSPVVYSDLADTVEYLLICKSAALLGLGLHEKTIKYLNGPDWEGVDRDLMWCEQMGNRIIAWFDPGYPPLLQRIACVPWVLYVRGCHDVLRNQQIAMVGSRLPSVSGREIAYLFGKRLTEVGLTVTSGMALGIDGASHRGALSAWGTTVAVMGAGLNHIYPRQHWELAEQILCGGGLLLSEFAPDAPILPKNFPRRNRIISGLSLGVLVVEAGVRSGSLITARYALEQGREVFAVPGSIHHPLSVGCHELIKQGAILTDGVETILENIGMLAIGHSQLKLVYNQDKESGLGGDSCYGQVTHCFTDGANSVDALIVRSGLTPGKVCAMLLEMEVNGHIRAVRGGYTRLRG